MKSTKRESMTREEIVELLIKTEQNLLRATQNLGHPAYGHSSATTIAIDDLREELFDFLEIPKV